MGQLNRDAIINQGMTLAGKTNTNLLPIVAISFNAWLRSTYKGWLWPFLKMQMTGVVLTKGATSLTIGGGGVNVADVFDPIYLWTTDYAFSGRARVRQLSGGPSYKEPTIINPSQNAGTPTEFKARPGTTEGVWTLTPYPFPDKTYSMSLDFKLQPPDLASTDIPRYENDRTLIQAAKVMTLEYTKDETYPPELQILADMVLQDYAKDAARTGVNDFMGLDPNAFK